MRELTLNGHCGIVKAMVDAKALPGDISFPMTLRSTGDRLIVSYADRTHYMDISKKGDIA